MTGILLLLFISLEISASAEIANTAYSTEKKKLMKAITEFNLAFKECDLRKLSKMITDNYIHTNSHWKAIGKKEWLAYLGKRRKDIDSGKLLVKSYEVEESDLKIHGDMAIFTAKIKVSSILSGDNVDNEYRVTNIWVLEDEEWKRAAFHDTKIK